MEAKDLTSLCVTVLMVTANGAVVKQAVGLFITAVINTITVHNSGLYSKAKEPKVNLGSHTQPSVHVRLCLPL